MPGGLTAVTRIDDRATTPLLRLNDNIRRPEIRRVMGRAIGKEMRTNFTELDRTRPNKLGGERTHFYGDARRGVQQPELIGGDGVKVTVNQVGIAQRYFGGPIVPRVAKFLTIPVHPEAYGHRAREFALHAIFFRDGTGILVRDTEESKSGIGEVFFRLVKRTYQQPDPSVLPTDEELQQVAVAAGDAHVRTLIARGGLGA